MRSIDVVVGLETHHQCIAAKVPRVPPLPEQRASYWPESLATREELPLACTVARRWPHVGHELVTSWSRVGHESAGARSPGSVGCAFSTRVRDSTLRRRGFAHSCQIGALVSDSRNEAPRPDGARLSTVTMAVDPSPISTGLPVASLRFNSSASVSPVT